MNVGNNQVRGLLDRDKSHGNWDFSDQFTNESSVNMGQQMEGFQKTMAEYVDQQIEQRIKDIDGRFESRFTKLETMMTAMMAKLGV